MSSKEKIELFIESLNIVSCDELLFSSYKKKGKFVFNLTDRGLVGDSRRILFEFIYKEEKEEFIISAVSCSILDVDKDAWESFYKIRYLELLRYVFLAEDSLVGFPQLSIKTLMESGLKKIQNIDSQ